MLIATAQNITPNLAREDGTAKYDVWVGVNQMCIWRGTVDGHVRMDGAPALLRLIAETMERRMGIGRNDSLPKSRRRR